MTGRRQRSAWPLALLLGSIYLAGGLLWFLSSIGSPLAFPASPDPISSLMLIIISIVFLSGVGPLYRLEREGYAYIAVGMFLAGVLFVLQLVITGTNYLGWILGFEDWQTWTLVSDITPTIWLFPLIVLAFGIARVIEGASDGNFTKHLLEEA